MASFVDARSATASGATGPGADRTVHPSPVTLHRTGTRSQSHVIARHTRRFPVNQSSDKDLTVAGVALRFGIVALALGTAYIHSTLGGLLFTLNAIGYVVASRSR